MPVETLPGFRDYVKYHVRQQPDLGGIYKSPSFLKETVIIAKPEVLPVTPSAIAAESVSTASPRTKSDEETPSYSNTNIKVNNESMASVTFSSSRERRDYSITLRRRGSRPRRVCPECQTSYRLSESHQCRKIKPRLFTR